MRDVGEPLLPVAKWPVVNASKVERDALDGEMSHQSTENICPDWSCQCLASSTGTRISTSSITPYFKSDWKS